MDVTVELQLHLDPDMFERLYAHSKANYELELLSKKTPMAETHELTKEICDAFPEIKFDGLRACFYNEAEEIAMWNLRGKDKGEISECSASTRRMGCGCCTILQT
eukprot:TRINITY_DN135718_c1_g1_i1.p6 TRINITY_DN135718_c1_g1~~TRINITY_DN135718_c1_g1_i1.p6  ORF type:complete len:105 (-),score=10.09 TRINITY_DN135718_c1_g1_i1:1089-1403(-)